MHTGQKITTFKERLTDLCYTSAQNDTEIAKSLNISKQTLSAWKCGTRSPKQPTIECIARYFGVNIDWLMGFDVPMKKEEKPIPEDELDRILVNALMDLTPQETAQVLAFVSGLKAARKA